MALTKRDRSAHANGCFGGRKSGSLDLAAISASDRLLWAGGCGRL
jgi:hypothetical protein